MKSYREAAMMSVNGRIDWYPVKLGRNRHGEMTAQRIRGNGKLSRPKVVRRWLRWEGDGTKLTIGQFRMLAEIEWELKKARLARRVSEPNATALATREGKDRE